MKGLGILKRITLILMVLFVYPSFGADVLSTPATCDNETLRSDGDPVSLRAEWTANTFTLNYYDGDEQLDNIVDPEMTQCTYNEKIAALPDGPEKPGYAFRGWRVRHKCTLRDSWDDDMANERIEWDYRHFRWKNFVYCEDCESMTNSFGVENSDDLEPGEWAVLFNDGELRGLARCSKTAGEMNDLWNNGYNVLPGNIRTDVSDDLNQEDAQYCWCAGISFDNQCTVASPSWVFLYEFNSAGDCAGYCALSCANGVFESSAFRRAVFGMTQ
jgi:hypothetical protein